jgi:hypothetical protein
MPLATRTHHGRRKLQQQQQHSLDPIIQNYHLEIMDFDKDVRCDKSLSLPLGVAEYKEMDCLHFVT